MSFWEFLVIVVIALLVVGPQRLYEIAVVLGRMTRRARLLYADVKEEMDREFRDDKKPTADSGNESSR